MLETGFTIAEITAYSIYNTVATTAQVADALAELTAGQPQSSSNSSSEQEVLAFIVRHL